MRHTRSSWAATATLAFGAFVAAACGDEVPARERGLDDVGAVDARQLDTGSQTPPATPDTVKPAEACIRGGTPRADVVRIMGEPDSTVYGSWFYGSSELLFGYGVVLEIRDRGELVLCE